MDAHSCAKCRALKPSAANMASGLALDRGPRSKKTRCDLSILTVLLSKLSMLRDQQKLAIKGSQNCLDLLLRASVFESSVR